MVRFTSKRPSVSVFIQLQWRLIPLSTDIWQRKRLSLSVLIQIISMR
ncbi:hypothetical protein X736_31035 [Mesorhizobium sp. L2C089B000]|nr:hypothetical protein X736_31035 [Mesorhizobium sp. L2C089B000]